MHTLICKHITWAQWSNIKTVTVTQPNEGFMFAKMLHVAFQKLIFMLIVDAWQKMLGWKWALISPVTLRTDTSRNNVKERVNLTLIYSRNAKMILLPCFSALSSILPKLFKKCLKGFHAIKQSQRNTHWNTACNFRLWWSLDILNICTKSCKCNVLFLLQNVRYDLRDFEGQYIRYVS